MTMKTVLLGGAAALALTGVSAAAPTLGGSPASTTTDGFAAGTWSLGVSSYVYDSNSDTPGSFGSLNDGEFLFMYLLESDAGAQSSVDMFSVGIESGVGISALGYNDSITPDGFAGMGFQSPSSFGYNANSGAASYGFLDFNDPSSTLDPGEYSLVWFIAEAEGYTMGSATATGGGTADTNQVLVPTMIPAPGAAIALLAGLPLARRRRRD